MRKVLCLSLLSYLNIFSVQGNDGYLYLLIDRHLVFGKGANQINPVGNILQSTKNDDGVNIIDCCELSFISLYIQFLYEIFSQSIAKL